jgi:serine/threonine protein kinase
MRSYNHLVDWWSLGILMYALLAGRFPIDALPTHEAMLLAVMSYDYSLPKDVDASEAAQNFLRNVLTFDPVKRLKNKQSIQRQAFFHKLDFDAVYNRQVSVHVSLSS